MSRAKVPESSFRHYMRVRIGVDGPKGRLLRCEKRDHSDFYWRIKLQSGEWVWPDERMILDGPGTHVVTCGDCEIRFMSDGRSPLCPSCDPKAFGTPSDIRNFRAYTCGTRTPMKVEKLTPEDSAAAAEQRRRDEDKSPF